MGELLAPDVDSKEVSWLKYYLARRAEAPQGGGRGGSRYPGEDGQGVAGNVSPQARGRLPWRYVWEFSASGQ